MDIKSIREYMGADWTAVQERIGSALHSDINLLNATNESILSHSGKQMRPLLSLIMARACSGGREASDATVRYAAASELLHNATLLHDDVADDSDQRRGVPTIMSLMGPAVSVLVGDYWLVKAVELVLDASDGDMRVIRLFLGTDETDTVVMRVFSKTLSDLAEGEMLQLQKAQSCDTDFQDYLRIIYNKTASLFEAACSSAAISVAASDTMAKAAVDYARSLGIAFQIKDDILDYAGTDAVGKPLGADILEQKITMPLLGALGAVDVQKAEQVRKMISEIQEHPEYRDEIVRFVKENDGVGYAVARLNDYVDMAVKALEPMPASKAKDSLVELAHFTAERIM